MPAISTAITAATALAGIGSQAYGMSQQMHGASAQNAYEQQIIQDQLKQEALRKQAMELDARRKQMEAIRNQQRARAISLTNATSQGAQFGSGLAGGYGQISGETNTNLLGISQGLNLGEQNFGLNSDISQAKIGIGQAQTQINTGQGFANLGRTLISALPTINKIGQGFTFSPNLGSSATNSSMSTYGGWTSNNGYGPIY